MAKFARLIGQLRFANVFQFLGNITNSHALNALEFNRLHDAIVNTVREVRREKDENYFNS